MDEENTWETRRQKLIRWLKEYEGIYDLQALMREMEYTSKKILIKDIGSIARTLRNEGIILKVHPATCRDCGYIFRQKKHKIKIPSKCPKCRSERIAWPSLKVERK